MNALQTIQQRLKVPKSQRNTFGNYNFRSQEDILDAVKPLLAETKSTLKLTDELVLIGNSIFVKAVAILTWVEGNTSFTEVAEAYAEHAKEQKGMNPAQITGSTSSYARKYALNGLFLIDDAKDADATNTHGKEDSKSKAKKETKKAAQNPAKQEPLTKKELLPETDSWKATVKRIKETAGTTKPVTIETIEQYYTLSPENKTKLENEAKN